MHGSSILLSLLAAAAVGLGIARSSGGAILSILILALSRAFVDYSTSGLENPLTHLLAAMFCLVLFRYEISLRTLAVLSIIASLGALNRMDAILLFMPALACACLTLRRWTAAGIVALGFLPLIAWEAFSLIYYGFLFPNSAYAKLYTGLSRIDLIGQGFRYLLDSLTRDPLTLVVIAIGVMAVPFFVRGWRAAAIAGGVALSLVYVVSIGGDFMTGRFLSAPLLIGAILISVVPFRRRLAALGVIPAFGLLLALGGAVAFPTFRGGGAYGLDTRELARQIERSGISDERAFYYPVTGLFRAEPGPVPSPRQVWVDAAIKARQEGRKVVVRDAVGFFGCAGPDVHVVDQGGSRRCAPGPAPTRAAPAVRIGHFFRTVPPGYVESPRCRTEPSRR